MPLCQHPETVIDHDAETVEEVCVECGETVQVIEKDEEPVRCGYELDDGSTCQNRVKNEGDLCWRHP